MPKGFTLPEVLIDLVLFSAIAIAIFSSLIFLQRSINLAKIKIQAVELANQKIEELRNLPYDSLSTEHGTIYPAGQIADTENLDLGNTPFVVQTTIKYVDDPYDGNFSGTIPGKPQDFYPYDYKKAEVKITTPQDLTVLAQLSTNVSGKASETSGNSGILSIKVLNSHGQPKASAQVVVTNSFPNPPVDIHTFTDSLGLVVIPILPPDSSNHYHVTATAPGESTDSTNPITAQLRHPVQPDLNVLVQQVTNQTLSVDALANINITIKDLSDTPLPNVPITVTSNKLLYTNPTVYKYQQTFNSNAGGNISLAAIEWDSYSLTPGNPYIISSVSPYQPIPLEAGSTVNADVFVTTSTTAPTFLKTEPLTAPNNAPLTLTFTGANFALTGASVTLAYEVPPTPTPTPIGGYDAGDTLGTEVTVTPDRTQLFATFDFINKMPGSWSIRITNPNGEFVKQPKGITITIP